MKVTNKIFALAAAFSLAVGCNDGIDPISRVKPGNDETAPAVQITSPTADKIVIPFTQDETDMSFGFRVTDDIEVKSVELSVDGTSIATFDEFTDYRIVLETYVYENLEIGEHTVTVTATDMSNKETTQSFDFTVTNVYEPIYDGEIFYMPFEASVNLDLISGTEATKVGSPTFTTGKIGSAYQGATNSYLTFPTSGLGLGDSFSIVWWYKVNVSPERAGIMVVGPPGINTRTSGFRIFREGGKNNFKANMGNGTADAWNDGGAIPSTEWVLMAYTVGGGKTRLYADGALLRESTYTGTMSWADTDFLSIGSGETRFTEWGHLSDLSGYDEIRIFNKVLSAAEITTIKNDVNN